MFILSDNDLFQQLLLVVFLIAQCAFVCGQNVQELIRHLERGTYVACQSRKKKTEFSGIHIQLRCGRPVTRFENNYPDGISLNCISFVFCRRSSVSQNFRYVFFPAMRENVCLSGARGRTE